MEAHPIPQNVSSFQFRLIGDMTLKQFAYLASGAVVAYLIFVFFAARYGILAWPLIVLFAGTGAAFAFLPIGSRPLDHWVGAFLKAIYSPTKRVWRKNDKTFREDPLFLSRYTTYLSALQQVPPSEPISKPQPILYAPPQKPAPSTPSVPQTEPSSPLPSPEELKKTVELAKQAQNLKMQIVQTERTLNQIKAEAQKPQATPIDYTYQVNEILSNLQRLVEQASQIKRQLDSVKKPEKEKPKQPLQPIEPPKVIKVSAPVRQKTQTLALTTFPNVISGIVQDSSSNYIEGVICVIYDKEGLPVRALKTNKLGQFTGSTPLPNGVYNLELEKEGFSFDVLQLELAGAVLPPLMITAK